MHGASPEQWAHLAYLAGLAGDLLPVVSDPSARISPTSSLKSIGKTPSTLDNDGLVVGISQWTRYRATDRDIEHWSRMGYGICVQTRHLRAIDVDITDPGLAREIDQELPAHLPRRRRANSSKFLVAFFVAGTLTKRIHRCEHGAIEFLANGQQFVAVGTHPSGARYEWENGMPDAFPTLTLDELELIWV